jgi:serine O-acetyltransferase
MATHLLPADRARYEPDAMSGVSCLKADFRANAPELPDAPGVGAMVRALGRHVPTVRFLAVLLLRIAQSAGLRIAVAGSVVKQVNHVLTGADIAYQARIGPGLVLYHPTGVVMGPGCRIGANARIMQGATIGSNAVTVGEASARSPSIGDDAFIGPHAVLFGDVRLGNRVQVGAGSVVTSSFGDDVVVAGAPARIVRERRP